MGAQDFSNRVKGKSPQDAFETAVTDARYEYGHGGYTGTIAEKYDFFMVEVPEGKTPEDVVGDYDHQAYRDKWGPAGCIDLGDGEYLFFGSASS